MSSADAVAGFAAELGELVGAEVALERPANPEHGDYATNVALRLAAARRRPPRELGEELAAQVAGLPQVERAEVAGPGFVNLWLADEWYASALEAILAAGRGYAGGSEAERRQRVQVEMVSANPTGPLTVATARNGAYGDSVARLLEFAGHAVEREYYYNDAGTQMERFRASVEARRRGEEPPEEGYRGAYVDELARVSGDPVPAMLEQIERTLERFRIHFDSWALQSELELRLPELLPRLDTYVQDGAIWARSSAYGDDQDRVIVRSPDQGGAPTYRGADVVYLADKLERGFDRAIYVLGADHHGTRKWYAAVAAMFGYDPARVEVLLYQLVHLTRGGEQTKISKRRGDVVLLDEFMDEIGVDAARWYLVSRGPDQAIDIDVDLAAEKTQKNPVYYVQYAHARIAGILRNAGEAKASAEASGPLAREERELVKRLLEFPGLVAEATERRAPHALPTYAIRVADDFHRFYHEHRVLGSEAQAFRLGLVRATQAVIARSLDLIGVEAPERM
ncbi:MAG TPA: arginine--tRNA ligase [Gaiellaceae bacterium]|jgi:arginyl-tRNA synthetase|nr:arginine--tRNA ligase [Gaiellaceae bacterium]